MLQLKQVINVVTLSKATIYRLIKVGDFPAPVQLSPGRVAWQDSDIESWRSARPRSAKIGGQGSA